MQRVLAGQLAQLLQRVRAGQQRVHRVLEGQLAQRVEVAVAGRPAPAGLAAVAVGGIRFRWPWSCR